MPAAALAIPSAISAGTSIFGAISGRNAAKRAGTAQANAAAENIDYINNRLREGNQGIDTATGTASSWTQPAADFAQSLMYPYIGSGTRANTTLQDLLVNDTGGEKFAYDPSKVADDPGYQFTLAQGMKALEQSAAARGQTLSGGQQKAIAQFSQGNAATYENQFFKQALDTFTANRDTRQQRIANLFGLSSQGLNAGQYAGNVGIQQTEYASDAERQAAEFKARLGLDAAGLVGNARTGAANTTAASILAGNNSMRQGLQQSGQDLGQAIFLSQLMKKPPGSSGTNYPSIVEGDYVRPGDESQFGG